MVINSNCNNMVYAKGNEPAADCAPASTPMPMPFQPQTNMNDRTIYFTGDVTDQSATMLISEINSINSQDARMKKIYGKKYKIKPIKLYINTYGGDCVSGLSIIDAMNNSKAPIYTIVSGACASMGIPIFVSGTKRFATKNSSFMIHGVSSGMWGKIPNLEEELDLTKHLEDVIFDIIIKNTKIKQSKIEKKFKKDRSNWWFFYDDAVKYGLVTDDLKDIDKKIKKKHKKEKTCTSCTCDKK